MKGLIKIIPWFFVALFGIEIIAVVMPKKESEFHLREFGRLPVLLNGRVQPLDSVGRNALLQIRSTGDVPLELVPSWKFWYHPPKLRSSEWLAEVLFKPEVADTRPIFLIHHPELLSELNLQDKGIEKSGLRYYTFNELIPSLKEVQEQASNAPEQDALRTPIQKQVLKLFNGLFLYQAMKTAARPPSWENFEKDLTSFEKGLAAVKARDEGKDFDKEDVNALAQSAVEIASLARDRAAGARYPLVIPPYLPEHKREDWSSMSQTLFEPVRQLLDSSRSGASAGTLNVGIPKPAKLFAAMASAYNQGDAARFNSAVTEYKSWLGKDFSPELKKGREEFFFNDTKGFLHAMIIYLAAFVLAVGGLLTLTAVPVLSESLRKSSCYLIILAGVVHTFGLVFRMYLEGRPPVTNLYSSAIFIGWGAMVLGVILERIYRLGLGNIVASVAGFVTLVIAHNLALGGDTMEMMRAVLDTNFWLATHVVAVTMGYAATFVAGLLGIVFILLGVFTPLLRQKLNSKTSVKSAASSSTDIGKALAKMAYAIICFATLFSFVGTVLGGIWADQSWGRFWGWDPKENGALVIVLWNVVILHARWGGLIKERGLMAMAVFGNIVTAWSWFGVNMLGVGLHSYGFMDGGAKWLYYVFVPSQLAIIALGLLPLSLWKSFRTKSKPTPSVPDVSATAPA
ncbi:MAG TPA: cytochrome c biogenesis protein CcsA [Candidatus Acidoferrum sp.]|nr:cytochrome c biogenesis protein CcsA [Candidatus Acidoferrum sp.]